MSRQYQIVLFGATGYTGKLTAQCLASSLPTNMTWAIAGRSESRLKEIAEVCKSLSPDRIQPAIEICNLNDVDLADLARNTTLLISTVGPYSAYGEHAFKACAENGTHYLDCTGESPWVKKMINRYENAAKASGAIMLCQVGVESMPSDLMTWALVSLIRKEMSAPTGEVVFSVDLNAHISGGTLATFFALLDHFSLSEVVAASTPFALSPIPGPAARAPISIFTRIFGVRSVSGQPVLTTSLQAASDESIVQRSWGLLGGAAFYGPNFIFSQYSATRNIVTGVLMHGVAAAIMLLTLLPPLRWLAARLVTQPGHGASPEESKTDYVAYKGVGSPDVVGGEKRSAWVKARYDGSMYALTAMTLAQAALTVLKDDTFAKKTGGGILTTATLGQPFVDRLRGAGFEIQTGLN